jgi:hypothetical protein
MKVVEWRGTRVPKVRNGVLRKGYMVMWTLTLECGHVCMLPLSNKERPPKRRTCGVCEGGGSEQV